MIQNLEQIREDGRILKEGSTLKDLNTLGWPVSRITKLRWKEEQHVVEILTRYGFVAKVVPSRRYLFAMEFESPEGSSTTVSSFNANGLKVSTISKTIDINGREQHGEYQWFEPARVESADASGLIFTFRAPDASYESDRQIDIDAATGKVVGIYTVR